MSKGISFANEREKLSDMKKISKKDFIKSYSYLTEEDYFATCKELFSKLVSGKHWQLKLIDKLIPENFIPTDLKLLFALYAQSATELEYMKIDFSNDYINSATSLAYPNGNPMQQFRNMVVTNYNLSGELIYPRYCVAIENFRG